MSDAPKPPAKHLPHGNYARADWFEAECARLTAERDRIQQSHDLWDKKHDGLKTRNRELEAALRWVKSHGSKHGMPDEILATLETIGKDE